MLDKEQNVGRGRALLGRDELFLKFQGRQIV
jgi:hypothetical protein